MLRNVSVVWSCFSFTFRFHQGKPTKRSDNQWGSRERGRKQGRGGEMKEMKWMGLDGREVHYAFSAWIFWMSVTSFLEMRAKWWASIMGWVFWRIGKNWCVIRWGRKIEIRKYTFFEIVVFWSRNFVFWVIGYFISEKVYKRLLFFKRKLWYFEVSIWIIGYFIS